MRLSIGLIHMFVIFFFLAITHARSIQEIFSVGGQLVSPDDLAARNLFVHHFSGQTSGTATYLQSSIGRLYPESEVVVTQDNSFQLMAYALHHPDEVAIHEVESANPIKRFRYSQPSRRRDGDGVLSEQVVVGSYLVSWSGETFTAVVARWQETYIEITQWHLISDDVDKARALIHTVSSWATTMREAVLVFNQGFWTPDHALWQSVQRASWDDVILDEEFKARLRHDYLSFFKSEDIYADLGVPWKRGLIFLGPPGNGKTISLKAIMHEVNAPTLYVKSFHTFGGDEMGIRLIFTRARAEAPCIIVFEDLDSLITDQNRAFFLNEVDGLEDNDGLLLIGTTNHFDRLDPALSNRPSRFDRKYFFPNPTKAERRSYAVYWQDKLAENDKIDFPDWLIDDVAEKTHGFSFAYLKEAFIAALLTLAGDETKEEDFATALLQQIKYLREQLDAGDQELGFSGNAT